MRELTRSEFLKLGAAGAAAFGVCGLGFDADVARATTVKQRLRIKGEGLPLGVSLLRCRLLARRLHA